MQTPSIGTNTQCPQLEAPSVADGVAVGVRVTVGVTVGDGVAAGVAVIVGSDVGTAVGMAVGASVACLEGSERVGVGLSATLLLSRAVGRTVTSATIGSVKYTFSAASVNRVAIPTTRQTLMNPRSSLSMITCVSL
jgi:hypothetical protein